MRELVITAVILAPCAREFLGVGADVAEVISVHEPGWAGRAGEGRAESGNVDYSREVVNVLKITYHFTSMPAGYPLQNVGKMIGNFRICEDASTIIDVFIEMIPFE